MTHEILGNSIFLFDFQFHWGHLLIEKWIGALSRQEKLVFSVNLEISMIQFSWFLCGATKKMKF